ncbi:MAG: RluA family pseudouridine synthase [Opitutales bacterium]|nr:RluA family pseudouridine synthase [Opitutales bacterium]
MKPEPEETAGEGALEIVLERDSPRADKALVPFFPQWSRSRVQTLFTEGRVWRDDAALAKKKSVRAGEVLTVYLPPERVSALRPVALPLAVLYEDADLLVLNKDAGRVVHPGSGTGENTLAHALLHHCGPALAEVGSPERPGIVHRLDKDTTGVMAVAKTPRAYRRLVEIFSERQCEKAYTALGRGLPAAAGGEIREPVGRHPVQRHRMAVVPGGRPALSRWRVAERFGDCFALLDVAIHTGRTHQIRVHMAWLGHPLAGDTVYGYRARPGDPPFPRVMLHARRLAFAHPVSGTPMEFTAPQPDDLQAACAALRAGNALRSGRSVR